MFKVALSLALFALILTPLSARAEKPSNIQTDAGTFLYLEQGDYAHWFMRLSNGKKVSYYILHPDKSLKKVLKSPTNHMNQACRIQWKSSVEDLPEAGGKMQIDQILSVEWIGSPQ